MKTQLVLVALFAIALSMSVSAIDCPFCSGKAIEYYNVEITPEEKLYGEEVFINITLAFQREYRPIDEKVDVEIWYYNNTQEVEKMKFKTTTGQVSFTPKIVGYHLVKTCGKSILIYVNTTCGDAVCGGSESRSTCVEDCGDCGDGICDSNEDLSCTDCAVCGDGTCSSGETRSSCIKDCVFCGDGICDYLEDRNSCSDDCESGVVDGCCDGEEDGICDPECGEEDDPDCAPPLIEVPEIPVIEPTEERDDNLILIVAGMVVIALALVAIFISRGHAFLRSKAKSKKKQGKKKTKKAKPKD